MSKDEALIDQIAETMWQAERKRAGNGGPRKVPWSEVAEKDRERYHFVAREVAALSRPSGADAGATTADEKCWHCNGTGQPGGIMGGPEHGVCSYCMGTRYLPAPPLPEPVVAPDLVERLRSRRKSGYDSTEQGGQPDKLCDEAADALATLSANLDAALTREGNLSHEVELFKRNFRIDTKVISEFMLRNGFATGHGDTTADLIRELEWQIKERAEAAETNLDEVMRAATAHAEARIAAEAEGARLTARVEDAFSNITMQDIRLAAGEGELAPHNVVSAVNIILGQRRRALLPAKKEG